jgi:hypothetical protein
MRLRRWISIPGLAALFTFFPFAFAPRAGASPPYAIAATNVTMSASGSGTTSYTVTGIPMSGSLIMSCQYSGSQTIKAKIPVCGGAVADSIPVTAGQTVTGTIGFSAPSKPFPVDWHRTRRNGASAAALSLAGTLLFGFGFQRRFKRNSAALLLTVCAFAILPIVSACGGNGNGMTPGTYPYTITADNEASPNTPLGQGVSTTIDVTVP